jgi:hypothetical protein
MKPRRQKIKNARKHSRKGEQNMFTNKHSRREQTSQSRSQYIEPFDEADTAPEAVKSAGTGYMAELEEWLDFTIFEPLENAIASGDTKVLHLAFNESKQLLKRKVLASYHNGLKAKTPTNQKNYGQQTHRRN